jgi:adenosylcobinamide amidohydrolase
MVEAGHLAASAKTAALHQAGITSRKSQKPAIGTGTDCTAIIASGEIKNKYCGLHTVVGELIGKAVFSTITNAIKR